LITLKGLGKSESRGRREIQKKRETGMHESNAGSFGEGSLWSQIVKRHIHIDNANFNESDEGGGGEKNVSR